MTKIKTKSTRKATQYACAHTKTLTNVNLVWRCRNQECDGQHHYMVATWTA